MRSPLSQAAVIKYAAVAGLVITTFGNGLPWYCNVFFWLCQ